MISVVTLTYNNYEELVKTSNSLQGVSSIESIVVNYEWLVSILKKWLRGEYLALIPASMDGRGISSTGEDKALKILKRIKQR